VLQSLTQIESLLIEINRVQRECQSVLKSSDLSTSQRKSEIGTIAASFAEKCENLDPQTISTFKILVKDVASVVSSVDMW